MVVSRTGQAFGRFRMWQNYSVVLVAQADGSLRLRQWAGIRSAVQATSRGRVMPVHPAGILLSPEVVLVHRSRQ